MLNIIGQLIVGLIVGVICEAAFAGKGSISSRCFRMASYGAVRNRRCLRGRVYCEIPMGRRELHRRLDNVDCWGDHSAIDRSANIRTWGNYHDLKLVQR